MSRTKQSARKHPKAAGFNGKPPRDKTKTKGAQRDYGVRHYKVIADGDKETVTKSITSRDGNVSEYFQKKSEGEPALASLVHALNNAVGLPLLTTEDMFSAREELQQAAAAAAMELYLGTDKDGEGDWPIEVAQHALYKKLTLDNLELQSSKFGARPDGTLSRAVMSAVLNHAAHYDLVVELQFPHDNEDSSESKHYTGECAGYHWRDLPVGPNGERGHFVAVRNGLVYDSAAPASQDKGHAVMTFEHFWHTKKVYRLVVGEKNSGGDAAGNVAGKEDVEMVEQEDDENNEAEEEGGDADDDVEEEA